jgi:hypothetical protein
VTENAASSTQASRPRSVEQTRMVIIALRPYRTQEDRGRARRAVTS